MIKRLLILAFLTAVMLFGLLFSFQNTTEVALDLLVLQLAPQRVALWLLLAFALGGLLGMAVTLLAVFRLKSEQLLLKRKLERCHKSLRQLQGEDAKTS